MRPRDGASESGDGAEPRSEPPSQEELARDAVLEQMAHGEAYQGGHTTGAVTSHGPNVDVDRRPMLAQNGYAPEPRLISGPEGFEMVVFEPLPGSGNPAVVAFRGTEEGEAADWQTDFADPRQVGDRQYAANAHRIEPELRRLAAQYGQVEVTGHSLGGALAQIAAARNPDSVHHITTFQAPAIAREEIAQIQAHNDHLAPGQEPLEATHYRVDGDVVPLAGEAFAPGTVHDFSMAEDQGANLIAYHQALPVTNAALDTEAGRAALPGITTTPRDDVESVSSHDALQDNEEPRWAALAHRQLAQSLHEGEVIAEMLAQTLDRAAADVQQDVNISVAIAQQVVDAAQGQATELVEQVSATIDSAQATAREQARRARQAMAAAQRRASRAAERGQEAIDRAQASGVVPAQLDPAIDEVQRLVRSGVEQSHRALDRTGQLLERGVELGHRAVDSAQRQAGEMVRRGTQAIDSAQRRVNAQVARAQLEIHRARARLRRAVENAPQDLLDWIRS